MPLEKLPLSAYEDMVRIALYEDIGAGDLTTRAAIPPGMKSTGRMVAKDDLVLCGLDVAKYIFRRLDSGCRFDRERSDGEFLSSGEELLVVTGESAPMLTAERTALNFLQHLSGVATEARKYAEAVRGTGAKVLDTRKTLPGFRALEKYAVRMGGASNHRAGLYDGILLKENHIRAAGSIRKAVESCRTSSHHPIRIEVEVTDMAELEEALSAGAHIVMLDNFSPEECARAVGLVKGRAEVEASGGVSMENVRAYAEAGVDVISVGRITHSAPAVDISMLFEG